MTGTLANETAITGIGATEFSKKSGRTPLQLTLEAATAAIDDAGLEATDIDGLVTFTMDQNDEIEVARGLGLPALTHFSRIHYGGGAACATVHQAAMAVATGVSKAVLCYRGFNERSERRFGAGRQGPTPDMPGAAPTNWYAPFGFVTPASWVAMFAQRYMHEYGASSEDFGRVAVTDRKHAATNPKAWFYERPITLEEHQASRWIVEPLHLLDCCQESDGAVALVVTSSERARDGRHAPIMIKASAQGSSHDQESMTSYYRPEIGGLPEMKLVGDQLWGMSGLGPADVQAAMIYDHFTPFVLTQLEELGFCERGEARHFIADGNIELGGSLPLNTHGGQLGEAYIHGMNGIAEAVRQIRGSAVNQVEAVEHVVVTAGTGVPTSGLILGRA